MEIYVVYLYLKMKAFYANAFLYSRKLSWQVEKFDLRKFGKNKITMFLHSDVENARIYSENLSWKRNGKLRKTESDLI